MKAICSWSSGKDSALALHEARKTLDVVALLTTVTDEYERVSMHGVREEILDAQARAAGLPLHKVRIPSDCTSEIYEEKMRMALESVNVEAVVFGDLFLANLRAYRERKLAEVGMRAIFPLWMRPTRDLSREMVRIGLRAHLACVDPRVLDKKFAGRLYDDRLLDELPPSVDPCGENGEFHTCVSAGPMFSHSLKVEAGEVVERGGFVFADLQLPLQSSE
jgi:uncharacterized protein (TIGR00290 family)